MKNKTIMAYKLNGIAVKLRELNASPKVETRRKGRGRILSSFDSLVASHKQAEKKPISVSNV